VVPTEATHRPRRRLTASARREQLIDVATQLVVKDGFHAVSVESVAQHAGVTRAVIYQHFRDLQSLLEAVVEREMTRALAQVSETALADLSAGDPLELMLASLRAFLLAVQAHPTTWRLLLMPPEGAPKSLRKRIARGRATVLAQLAEAVQPTLTDQADPGDAELTARVLSAISDEYARLVLTDARRYPPERLLRHARAWLEQRPQ
jgi:AcrR family transcriptional regulator